MRSHKRLTLNSNKMKQCSKSNRRRILVIGSFCVIIFIFVITWSSLVNEEAGDEIEYEKQYYSDGKHKYQDKLFIIFLI